MPAPDSQPSLPFYDVAIIGAGFSGSILAAHLAAQDDPPRVVLIEKTRSFGPGIAYGAAAREHLLNVPAGKMSAFSDRPDDFLDWVRQHPELASKYGVEKLEAGAFLPRGLYGRYLAGLVSQAAERSDRLQLLDAEATDVEPLGDGSFRVAFADGGDVRTAHVVLAWGNFPPTVPAAVDRTRPVAVLNPWSAEAREALAAPGEVFIIGSGLTCLDLLATARRLGRTGRIHVLSRHGLFPQPHQPTPPRPSKLEVQTAPKTIRALFRAVRDEVRCAAREGIDWRAVVDGLRPQTQALWQGLAAEERRRFLRHVRPLWDTVRHRAAPEMRVAKDELELEGRLVRHRGRLDHITAHADGIEVVFRPRGSQVAQTVKVAAVINATGPESDPARINSPLLDNLLRRGLVRRDPLGLGIEAGLRQTDTDPLHTVGSLRKGELWESTAVPELRVQAQELARVLNESRARRAAQPVAAADSSDPGHFWVFEI